MEVECDNVNESYVHVKYTMCETDITTSTPKELFIDQFEERICCIELVNNNKIYIRYELDWTIETVYYNNFS
jgi:hypothetical protein